MAQGKESDAAAAENLRLMAFDPEDLAVIAAHVQDAILRVGDMLYLPHEKRFVLVLKRFDWLASVAGAPQRAQTGLHFEQVRKASLAGLPHGPARRHPEFAGCRILPGEPPGGSVLLVFSGGCAVRLEVECLEARMADLGPRWRVRHAPGHGVRGDARVQGDA